MQRELTLDNCTKFHVQDSLLLGIRRTLVTPKTFIEHPTQYLLYAGGNRSKHARHSLQECITIMMKNNLGFDTVSGTNSITIC